jgi:hypothetical protein
MHKQSIMRLDVSDFLLMSLSNQALPIFLNELLNTFFAILISVTLILMVGEVCFSICPKIFIV